MSSIIKKLFYVIPTLTKYLCLLSAGIFFYLITSIFAKKWQAEKEPKSLTDKNTKLAINYAFFASVSLLLYKSNDIIQRIKREWAEHDALQEREEILPPGIFNLAAQPQAGRGGDQRDDPMPSLVHRGRMRQQ